jgi:ABC-type glycerol-3-phosphate transport system substrate-binding protein
MHKKMVFALMLTVGLICMAARGFAAAPDTVTFWMPSFAESDARQTVEAYYFQEAANLYMLINPNVKVDAQMVSWANGDYGKKLLTAAAAGSPPDLVGYADFAYMMGGYVPESPKLRIDIPISKYYTTDELNRMGDPIIKAATNPDKKDSFILFPTIRSVSWNILAVNKKMFDDAGYKEDAIWKAGGWTFDEFRQAARTFTKNTGNTKTSVWGFGQDLADAPYTLEMFFYTKEQADRGPVVMKNAQPTLVRDAESYRTVFQLAQDMIYTDKTWSPLTFGLGGGDITNMFVQDQTLAMVCDGWYGMKTAVEQYNADIASGKKQGTMNPGVVWLPYPRFPTGKPFFYLYVGGIGAYKQVPYKGDAHTNNVLSVGKFLSSAMISNYWCVIWRNFPIDPRTRDLYPDSFVGNAKLDLISTILTNWKSNLFTDANANPVPPALTNKIDEISSPWAGPNTYRNTIQDVCQNKLTPTDAAKKLTDGIAQLIADWKAGKIK